MTDDGGAPRYARPVPTVGDVSSAAQRREDPAGWAMGETVTEALGKLAPVLEGDPRHFRVLSERIEEAAAREGVSVNAWLVRAAAAGLGHGGRTSGRTSSRQSYTGWVR